MARPSDKKHRGVYEHPAGSGVWWIHYYAEGRRVCRLQSPLFLEDLRADRRLVLRTYFVL